MTNWRAKLFHRKQLDDQHRYSDEAVYGWYLLPFIIGYIFFLGWLLFHVGCSFINNVPKICQ